MANTENFLAQLKAVVDPLTIFSHYLSLKKSGNRFKALCPFHSEKTPSFYAASNGMFHCFGCGMGGDVISFVMQIEKLDFKECIQLLSSRYGIPLKFSTTGERKEKDEMFDLMRQASDFYHNLLTNHESGKAALEYLKQRGISRETIKRFQLGWAPESWSALLDHFQKREANIPLLEKCGLIVARQREGHYDRYRSRIMIPIHDIHGNIIALGGRIFHGTNEEAKYLNSPETPIYSKSHHLFGLYFSKEPIQEKGFAILVEGYFDMIVPFQAGHTNIAASCGTSLTEGQARLLRRYADRIVIFYDPDTAGKNAVMRALPILLRENFAVSVGALPSGLDPDSFIRERGPEEFQNEIERAIRYDEQFLQDLQKKHDLNSSTGKLAASEEVMNFLDAIPNAFERADLLRKFALAVKIDPDLMHDQYRKSRKATKMKPGAAVAKSVAEIEKSLLRIFLSDLTIAREVLPEFEEEDLEEVPRVRQLKDAIASEDEPNPADIIRQYPPETQKELTALLLEPNAPVPTRESALDWLNHYIRPYRKQRQARSLNLDDDEALRQHESLIRESKRHQGRRMP
jgi:DNA primase